MSLYCYFGHHKAGSTWIDRIFSSCARDTGRSAAYLPIPGVFNNNLAEHVRTHKLEAISYSNASVDYIEGLDFERGFHVIRDPRDIAVSAYFSHLKTHPTTHWPELVAHRETLQSLSLEEGLLCDMEFCDTLPTYGDDLQLWRALDQWNYNDERILELKFEDLIQHPYEGFLGIFKHLGLLDSRTSKENLLDYCVKAAWNKVSPLKLKAQVPSWRLLSLTYEHSFEQQTQRQRGEEDQNRHLRKGIAGDWKTHFQEPHKAFFKTRYPELLQKLGYEKDTDW